MAAIVRAVAQLLAAVFLLLVLPQAGIADERILQYHSDITVHKDGTMLVVETIKVRAEGRDIKRGIYRDFPTKYKDLHGHVVEVRFDLIEVSKDGVSENYHTEQRKNGVRIYIGSKDRFLKVPAEYTYQITYETDRQLGFFEAHDELYWNVTGTAWKFAIDEASAAVHLPGTVQADLDIKLDGFTGPQGSRDKQYRTQITADNVVRFATTTTLPPYNGLTIVVMWPKGHVDEPGGAKRLGYVLADNSDLLIGAAGLLGLLLYYWYTWRRVGKDPIAGTIYPRYEPPAGFSPASMRFISRMGYDNKAFATALVNLGVNGHIDMTEDDGDYFVTLSDGDKKGIAPGESAIITKLFGGARQIHLKQKNHSKIGAALKAHKSLLKSDYERIYFNNNRKYVFVGLAVSVILIVAMFLVGGSGEGAISLFMTIWLAGWSFGVGALGLRAIRAFRAAKGVVSMVGAVFTALFALPFLIGEIAGFGILLSQTSLGAIVILVAVVVTNIGFYHWMKAPTRAGRELLDQIEGFKMYLSVAEKERLKQMQGPKETPELFEKYLPYALALDVEQPWSERFSEVLARAQASQNGGYRPRWYHGGSWDANRISGFTSSLGGSLASTIAAASTAPGSSSGGGGGGSSGGGGGGGGGGGW